MLNKLRKTATSLTGILALFWMFSSIAHACNCAFSLDQDNLAHPMVSDHQVHDCCDDAAKAMDDCGETDSVNLNPQAAADSAAIDTVGETIPWPPQHTPPQITASPTPLYTKTYLRLCRFTI